MPGFTLSNAPYLKLSFFNTQLKLKKKLLRFCSTDDIKEFLRGVPCTLRWRKDVYISHYKYMKEFFARVNLSGLKEVMCQRKLNYCSFFHVLILIIHEL